MGLSMYKWWSAFSTTYNLALIFFYLISNFGADESIQSWSPYKNVMGILIYGNLFNKGFLAHEPTLKIVFNAYSPDAGLIEN